MSILIFNFKDKKMQKGTVIEWNDDKGFGFIAMQDKSQSVFFHISSILNENRRPKKNDKVRFTLAQNEQGKTNAEKVTIESSSLISTNSIIGIVLLIFLLFSTLFIEGKTLILSIYFLMSALTYMAYAFDKEAAQNGKWRTPESSLHFLSLGCGWPGALMAQKRLRHKSQKQPFKTILWATIVANLLIGGWLVNWLGII